MRIRWRDFELPNRVVKDESVSGDEYGLFIAEPFQQGFAHTVGNGLRRVLLSSLEGTAVTHLRIQGVQHEFSTVEGVAEDVTEIVLNVKRILVRMESNEPRTLRLKKSSKGPVTAGDFESTAGVEVVNGDLYLCTIASDDVELEMEITVSRGRGYVTAEENAGDDMELGMIPVDSIFSPVQRVRYRSEATRVGKMTNFDKLVIEVWTDGTITPDLALVEASKIYRKHLNPFILPGEAGGVSPAGGFAAAPGSAPEESSGGSSIREVLNRPIGSLELSVRAANCMKDQEIDTVGELASRTKDDLLKVKNFGRTSLNEIEKKLAELGLQLGMDVDALMKA